MRLVLDMNLSPRWCEVLRDAGWECVHWSTVGAATAPDDEVMEWAAAHGYVLVTHDLDFSVLLARAASRGPSVVQVRAADVSVEALGPQLVQVLRAHEEALHAGALITLDARSARVRILPLRP